MPALPTWVNPEAWAGFVAMRRTERHPLTPRAAALVLSKLATFREAGADPNEILDKSTRNGWRDVFALDRTGANHANRSTSAVDRVAANIAASRAARGEVIEGTATRVAS